MFPIRFVVMSSRVLTCALIVLIAAPRLARGYFQRRRIHLIIQVENDFIGQIYEDSCVLLLHAVDCWCRLTICLLTADCWCTLMIGLHTADCWGTLMVGLHTADCWCTSMIGLHTADCWCMLMMGNVLQVPSTQLLVAAQDGDIATVRRLLAKGGVDVNVKNEVGVFPKGISGVLILNDKVDKFKKLTCSNQISL